jgi:hypothetical protein
MSSPAPSPFSPLLPPPGPVGFRPALSAFGLRARLEVSGGVWV